MEKCTPEELLRDISEKLNLVYEPQDWGIVNADGGRFGEFIDFLRQEHLKPTQEFEMAGLILASANERLLGGLEVDVQELLALAAAYPRAFSYHMDYWLGLRGDEDFPLSGILNDATSSGRRF